MTFFLQGPRYVDGRRSHGHTVTRCYHAIRGFDSAGLFVAAAGLGYKALRIDCNFKPSVSKLFISKLNLNFDHGIIVHGVMGLMTNGVMEEERHLSSFNCFDFAFEVNTLVSRLPSPESRLRLTSHDSLH